MVCLHRANKFCYDIAVSRVQLSIRFPKTFLFTYPSGGELNNTIVSFSEARGVKLLTQQAFNFKDCFSVQVGEDKIFQAYEYFTYCRMLKSDQKNVFSCTTQTILPLSATGLYGASMCGVNENFVYVTGGCNSEDGVMTNCHRYDSDRNQWQVMQ